MSRKAWPLLLAGATAVLACSSNDAHSRRKLMTEMLAEMIDRDRIAKTYQSIRTYIRETPVIDADGSDFGLSSARVSFKLESLQHSGSFKARGAFANLLNNRLPQVGVVAASGGNHGAAVAYAAMKLGVAARIFVPSVSSPAKIERIRGYGADLVVAGGLSFVVLVRT